MKRITIFITLTITILYILHSPISNFLKNNNMSYVKYVYLGGDDVTILINNTISNNKNSVTNNDKNAANGTLTYIDYDNNTYGAIAHNILDYEAEVNGDMFGSNIIEINKSINTVGNKVAVINHDIKYGSVKYISNTGVYGTYSSSYKDKEPIEVAMPSEIKLGKAYIITTIGEEKCKFEIKITNINMFKNDKNITFKITDQKLIDITGGIIKGMSGSPIIQNGKLIGALSHSYDNDFTKGNAIFITNMIK